MASASSDGTVTYEFSKTEGASEGKGELYEKYLCLLILLNLNNEFVDKFHLISNNSIGDKFDDIIFKVKYNEKKGTAKSKVVFLQATQSSRVNLPKIQLNSLLNSTKGHFSLQKYFISYQKIKYSFSQNSLNITGPIINSNLEDCEFIIYTNYVADKKLFEDQQNVERKIIEEDCILKTEDNLYYYMLSFNEEIKKNLKHSVMSELEQLINELVISVKNGEIKYSGILKEYQFALFMKVFVKIDDKVCTFKEDFIKGTKTFLKEDKLFRQILLNDLQANGIFLQDLSNKKLKIQQNLGSNVQHLYLPTGYVTDEEIVEFLKKFKLFCGQPGTDRLEEIVKELLQKQYKVNSNDINNVFVVVKDQVNNWWMEKEQKFLTEKTRIFEECTRTSIWFNVKSTISSFEGRKEELEKLHEMLQTNSINVISQIKSITGLGGIGKTELARRYAQIYHKEYDSNIIWIDAETEENIVSSFTVLAKDILEIDIEDSEENKKTITSIVRNVYLYFSKRKSLFIFDNVDESDKLNQYLPLDYLKPDDQKPFVLITSRIQNWGGEIDVLALQELKQTEAQDLFKKLLNIQGQEKYVDELVIKKLQQFPLALQQAASYIKIEMKRNSKYTIKDYLIEYESKTKQFLNFDKFRSIDNRYSKTTFTTFQITIDKIQKNEIALKILNIISYCAPDNIPKALFLKIAGNDWHELNNSIDDLADYSLIKSDENFVSVHRLIQNVTRLRNKEMERHYLETLLSDLEYFNIQHSGVDKYFENHWLVIWNYVKAYDDLIKKYVELWYQVLEDMAFTWSFKQQYFIAKHFIYGGLLKEDQLQTILRLLNVKISIQHDNCLESKTYCELLIEYARLLYIVGTYLSITYHFDEKILKDCNDILRTELLLLPDYPFLLHQINVFNAKEELQATIIENLIKCNLKKNLAIFHYAMENYEEASQIFNEIYGQENKNLGKNHFETLYTSQFVTYLNKGHCHDTMEKCEKILGNLLKTSIGENHPYIFFCRLNLANCLIKLKEFDEALKILKDMLIKCENVSKEHCSIMYLCQYNLAVCLYMIGDFAEAMRILHKAMGNFTKIINIDKSVNSAININLVHSFVTNTDRVITCCKTNIKNFKLRQHLKEFFKFNKQESMEILNEIIKENCLNLLKYPYTFKKYTLYSVKYPESKYNKAMTILNEITNESTKSVCTNNTSMWLKQYFGNELNDIAFILQKMCDTNDVGYICLTGINDMYFMGNGFKTSDIDSYVKTIITYLIQNEKDLSEFIIELKKCNYVYEKVLSISKRIVEETNINSSRVNNARFRYFLALLLGEKGEHIKAIELLYDIMEQENPIAFLNFYEIIQNEDKHSNFKNNLKEKIKVYFEALKYLANCLKKCNNSNEAIKLYASVIIELSKVTDTKYKSNVQKEYAYFLQEIGNYNEAIKTFNEYMTDDYKELAYFLLNCGKYEEAMKIIEKDDKNIYDNIEFRAIIGHYDEAIKISKNQINNFVRMFGSDTSLISSHLKNKIANILETAGKFQESLLLFEELHEEMGYHFKDIINCLMKMGNYDEAIKRMTTEGKTRYNDDFYISLHKIGQYNQILTITDIDINDNINDLDPNII